MDFDELPAAWLVPGVLALLAGVYFFGVPLLVLAQFRLKARPHFTPLDPDDAAPAVADFLEIQADALLALGFGPPVYYRSTEFPPNLTSHLAFFIHPGSGVMGLVNVQTWPNGSVKSSYVGFDDCYDSGRHVTTYNNPEPNALATRPESVHTQVPGVADAAELYALHRWVVAETAPDGRQVTAKPGAEVEHLYERDLAPVFDEQVRRGLFRPVPAGDAYALTLRGAYAFTWCELQPMKAFHMARVRRQERRVLAAFRAARG